MSVTYFQFCDCSFQPQVVGLPLRTNSKFEIDTDRNGNSPNSDNLLNRSFPPRKAISTIALNHANGWCPKSSNDCQSITGNQFGF